MLGPDPWASAAPSFNYLGSITTVVVGVKRKIRYKPKRDRFSGGGRRPCAMPLPWPLLRLSTCALCLWHFHCINTELASSSLSGVVPEGHLRSCCARATGTLEQLGTTTRLRGERRAAS